MLPVRVVALETDANRDSELGERDGGYEFAVEVRLPIIGRLVRYEGLLQLVT